jgi:release factor glutamine methyltransferase
VNETVRELLAGGRTRLAASPFGIPRREASLLLGRILGLSEAQLLARDHQQVDAAAADRFRGWLERRAAGEPAAYLLGEREFYGRTFAVDPRVLIPRPETEHVIEEALALGLPAHPLLLDIGTGSGCLAVTLALEIPASRVIATDLSPGALAVARANVARHGVADRVHLSGQDLAGALDLRRFDAVVSNPPYIDRRDAPGLSPEVCNFEPHLALFSPVDGDSTLARILSESAGLRPGTPLIVEVGHDQSERVGRLAVAAGFRLDRIRTDYAGIPRTLVFRFHEAR